MKMLRFLNFGEANFKQSRIYQFLERKKIGFLLTVILGIFIDVFIFRFTSDLVILTLTGLWIGAVIGWKLEGRFSILGALIFLTICPFLLIFKKDPIAEKAAIWAYMFLVVGVVQQLIEFKKKPKNLRDFDQFLKNLTKLFKKTKQEAKERGLSGILMLLSDYFKKQWGVVLSKIETWTNKSANNKVIKITKTAIISLVKFLSKFWFPFCSFLVIISIFVGAGKEIIFYHRFFENQYWQQLCQKLGVWLTVFWVISLISLFWILERQRNTKLKQVLIILLLFIFWQGNAIIFNKTRSKFTDKPYILRVSPSIASRYAEVKVYGRNFRDLPFIGKVLIDGKEQIVKLIGNERAWSNQEITIVADPNLSKTGLLEVWIDWDNKWAKSNRIDFTYYDSKTATPKEEKRFWESLKE